MKALRKEPYRAPFAFATELVKTSWDSFYLAGSTLFGPGSFPAKTFPGQFLSFWFFFCNVIILSSYTANLAAALSKSEDKEEIVGYENIGTPLVPFESIALGTVGGSVENFFNRQFGQMVNQANKTCFNCGWNETKLETTPWGHDTAIKALKDKSLPVRFILSDGDTLRYLGKDDCAVEMVGNTFYHQGYSFYLRKDSPWTSKVSGAVLELRESLMLEDSKKSYFTGDVSCGGNEEEEFGIGMRFDAMGGIFVIAGIALAIAFLLYALATLSRMLCKQAPQSAQTAPDKSGSKSSA